MKQEKIIRIGCVGDSITAGTGLKNARQDAFPAQLEKLLQNNTTVFNFGDGGKTMRNDLGVDSYVNSGTYRKLIQIADSLDIVTVMRGTNDAYHAKGWTEIEKSTFRQDCKALFGVLHQKNPAMQFVLMNSPECFGDNHTRYNMPPLRVLQKELADELNDAGYPTRYFDMYAVTKPLGEHFPDRLHPNEKAHFMMAEALSRVIEEMLK